jgi:uncharacterized YigZ family protein
MTDEFITIASETRAELKVQASRFIAAALPVATRAEAEQFLDRERRTYHDATHHCFAYRLGTDGTQVRFSDAGEPSGSAGKPILAAIDAQRLTNVIVVVTRYFGGTKLGVGGLVRAYSDAALLVLERAEKVTKYKTTLLEATFPHSHISGVMHVVSTVGAKIVDTTYDEDVHAVLEIRLAKAEELKTALVNKTRGNIALKIHHQ